MDTHIHTHTLLLLPARPAHIRTYTYACAHTLSHMYKRQYSHNHTTVHTTVHTPTGTFSLCLGCTPASFHWTGHRKDPEVWSGKQRVLGALLILFIFLNVLSVPYCQEFSPCNGNTAHSSFFQRSIEISGPYSVLLETIVTVFLKCV